jgi:hypothetical protein
VESAPLSPVELGQGHRVNLVALNHNQRPVCIETTVTDITAVTIPQSATPRFRAVNFGECAGPIPTFLFMTWRIGLPWTKFNLVCIFVLYVFFFFFCFFCLYRRHYIRYTVSPTMLLWCSRRLKRSRSGSLALFPR